MGKINFSATTDNGKAFRAVHIALSAETSVNDMTGRVITETINSFIVRHKDVITDITLAKAALTTGADGKRRFPVDRKKEKGLLKELTSMLPLGECVPVDIVGIEDGMIAESVRMKYTDGLYSGYVAVFDGESSAKFNKGVEMLMTDLFRLTGKENLTHVKQYMLASVGFTANGKIDARTNGGMIAKVKTKSAFAESIVPMIAHYFNERGMDCIDRTTEKALRIRAERRAKKYNPTDDNLMRILKDMGLIAEKVAPVAIAK